MTTLALDTSMNACSVALWRKGRILTAKQRPMPRGQAETLMPMIKAMIDDQSVAFSDIDRIAVSKGPGSFTGVRVGLSAAKALGMAAGIPVIGIDNFTLLAHSVPEDLKKGHWGLLSIIDTKRGDYYARLFAPTTLEPLSDPDVLPLDKIAALLPEGPTLLCGDGAEALIAALPTREKSLTIVPNSLYPDPATLAALADEADANAPDFQPTPLYLRPADATPSKMV